MAEAAKPSEPDFAQGIARDQIPLEGTLAGHVGAEAVLLSRLDGRLHAVSATCTHYGAPLAEGLASGGVVRCPWHHACFDLVTGEAFARRRSRRWTVGAWRNRATASSFARRPRPPISLVPRRPTCAGS